MNDTQIGDSLRGLPRTKASPAFTRNVLRAVHAPEERAARPLVWRFAAAFAMVACLIAVVNVTLMQQRRREETIALRAERQQLEADLQAVKKIATEAEPVVVLENDQGTRVIMDLDSAIQPASLRNYD